MKNLVMMLLMPTMLLVTNLAAGFAAFDQEFIEEQWESFTSTHGKLYQSKEEEQKRLLIFASNLELIKEHNQRYDEGNVSFKLAMNRFGDMLSSELAQVVTFTPERRSNLEVLACPEEPIHLNASELPDEVDWRKEGAVTPVPDQGSCFSSYAFSATGAVESHHFIKTGQLVDLSEQNLIDCSQDFGNLGCEGGRADQAFEYIIQNKGIDLEELYPYASKTMPCAFDKGAVGATISGFRTVPQSSEEQLQAVVATVGPVAVAVDATHDDFFQYDQGIYTNPFCSTSDVNYGLLIVGYGTVNGIDYWICKNSMGPDWGEHGYIRMARNKGNQCGIATLATYPEV
nr:procathepsin L-like isoform X2 [Dermacentor andersoni]